MSHAQENNKQDFSSIQKVEFKSESPKKNAAFNNVIDEVKTVKMQKEVAIIKTPIKTIITNENYLKVQNTSEKSSQNNSNEKQKDLQNKENKINIPQVENNSNRLDLTKDVCIQKKCGQENFFIYNYYDLQKIIGSGAYGVVCSAFNTRNNQPVAIKKIKNAFVDLIDTKRILREIKLLKFFKHINIVTLVDIIKPIKKTDFYDIYLVFELLNTDLEKVINSSQVLTSEHIKFFIFQLLNGVYFMHSADVIHRDLKPNNLLLNKNCLLKIADLGLARKFENSISITDYVVTRWYRAPEVMLSNSEYTKAIDIWSVGCIFAELIGRTPIFQGNHYLDQIERIVAIMGTPTKEDLPYTIDENTMRYLNSLPPRQKIKFENLYPNALPLELDLLEKMLTLNPEKRFTAEQCLNHPYLINLTQKQSLIKCTDSFDWSFDNIELKREKLQEAVYNEAVNYFQEKEMELKNKENGCQDKTQ